MRAAIFQAAGTPLVVGQVDDPAPGPDDVILKVEACGICGSDLHLSDNHDGAGGMAVLPPGSVMGHEFCGEIVAVGAGNTGRFRVGQRATAVPMMSCGACLPCLSGNPKRCREAAFVGIGENGGGYAEYVRVRAHETLALPGHFGQGDGALVEPLAVGLHAVERARLRHGDSVLVVGAGPVGLAVAMWCRHFGARHVVASDLAAARVEAASRFGATDGIDARRENVIERFRSIAGRRPDVVFDCVGAPGTLQLAMDYADFDSRVVVAGVCMHPDRILPVKAVTKELDLVFAYCYRRQDFQLTIEMLDAGRIPAGELVSDRVGFDAFPVAFEALKQPNGQVKVLLEPGRA